MSHGVASIAAMKFTKVACSVGAGCWCCFVAAVVDCKWFMVVECLARFGDDWNCWLRVRDSVACDMTLTDSSSLFGLLVWMWEMFIVLLMSGKSSML